VTRDRVPAAVRIELRWLDGLYGLHVDGFAQERPLDLQRLGGIDDLRRARRKAVKALVALKERVAAAQHAKPDVTDPADPRIEMVGDALDELFTAARTFRGALLGPRKRDQSRALGDYIGHSLSVWQAFHGQDPLVVYRALPDAMVPIELLPVSGMPMRSRPDDALGLRCERHLGFHAVVQRSFEGHLETSPDPVLRDVPKLPVKFLQYEGLPGARREAAYLSASARVDLDGPWPESATDITRDPAHVVASLFHPDRSTRGIRRSRPDQIQHLACHCRAHKDEDQCELRFGFRPRELRVYLKDLDDGFNTLIDEHDQARAGDNLPLIFLNACESSHIGMTSSVSFPRLFLEWGNRAVIGTEIPIPDSVAGEFGERFYRNLFAGHTVGQALLGARRRLLAVDRNPLGLVYTLYGDPDLHLASAPTMGQKANG
jgi:hypothetical protein